MDLNLRVVNQLPLSEIWDDRELVAVSRGCYLSQDDITGLLRVGPVQFVVATVGEKLNWVAVTDCYQFWKKVAKHHLAEPQSRTPLDQFPDSYLYFASRWGEINSTPVVLLEKIH